MFNLSIKAEPFLQPVDFKETNMTLKGFGDNVKDMKVFTDGLYSISCWQLSWKQAWSLLFKRKVWLSIMAGKAVPPVSIHIKKPIEYKYERDSK